MAIDWFLLDAPHLVPEEFKAWESARGRHRAVFLRSCNMQLSSADLAALDIEGKAIKVEVDRLEQDARQAWLRKLHEDRESSHG